MAQDPPQSRIDLTQREAGAARVMWRKTEIASIQPDFVALLERLREDCATPAVWRGPIETTDARTPSTQKPKRKMRLSYS